MRYSRVCLDSFGYELAPVVVSTAELEARLKPVYDTLKMPAGQLEMLTGITERRWWNTDFPLSQGAVAAARKALAKADFRAEDIDVLIYAGVCREAFEPATACAVAADLGLGSDAIVYDLSNACLGVLNGIIEIANRIELGQCQAGLVVSCETAREINEITIDRMMQDRRMEVFRESVATLTGGSGAVAVLVVDQEISAQQRRRLIGGASKSAPQYHALCRWGLEKFEKLLATKSGALLKSSYDYGVEHVVKPFMATDAGSVLKFGVELGMKTFKVFLERLGWGAEHLDKVICHQVGAGHRDAILKTLGIAPEKEFSTYEFLGNIGTVSLPLTAALAEEREFIVPGDRVGLLGIGSGLNCMMLGVEW